VALDEGGLAHAPVPDQHNFELRNNVFLHRAGLTSIDQRQ
jgi:hypothetical protein